MGAPKPEGIDGLDLMPVIRGERARVRDAAMLRYRDTQRTVRNQRWKLIRYPKINITRLFDLKSDPHETTDLAGSPKHQEVVQEMMALLKAEQKRHGDTLPLVSEKPLPAEFTVPTDIKIKPRDQVGGLAPPFRRSKREEVN